MWWCGCPHPVPSQSPSMSYMVLYHPPHPGCPRNVSMWWWLWWYPQNHVVNCSCPPPAPPLVGPLSCSCGGGVTIPVGVVVVPIPPALVAIHALWGVVVVVSSPSQSTLSLSLFHPAVLPYNIPLACRYHHVPMVIIPMVVVVVIVSSPLSLSLLSSSFCLRPHLVIPIPNPNPVLLGWGWCSLPTCPRQSTSSSCSPVPLTPLH